MRVDYFTQIPLTLAGGEIPAGALIATLEVPEGIPLEKAVNAIAVGHATPTPEKKAGALESAAKIAAVEG